jgi:GNAT superfamily N-acetyltransferase
MTRAALERPSLFLGEGRLVYELRRVAAPEDWQAMHAIRRATLFVPGRHHDEIVYDDKHPDDHDPANQPFLLVLDGAPIGVVRLDRRGGAEGVVRLVAMAPERQRQGHGRAMSNLVDAEARRWGLGKLFVNAYEGAVGFYQHTGWMAESWDPGELVGAASHCVQMAKRL